MFTVDSPSSRPSAGPEREVRGARSGGRPRRLFTQEDEVRFAELSGDWNPMHVDPVAARRTPYGPIVHGIHVLAWVLDSYLAEPGASVPTRASVAFLEPVGLSEEIEVIRVVEGADIFLLVQRRSRTLVSVRVTPGGSRSSGTCASVAVPPARVPDERAFAEARGLEGSTDAWGDAIRVREAFPNLVAAVGSLRVAALLALSRLVGMVCPGLHSVFAGLEFAFTAADDARVRYQVIRHSVPSAPVRIAYSGAGLKGSLDAFFRPSPAAQIGTEAIRRRVRPDEFAGQLALVIGGSRGLGEATAKIIAAGGGRTIVTYRVGEDDARRVAEDIAGGGGRCAVMQLDALDPEAGIEALLTSGDAPTHVYYFASPAIRGSKGPGMDRCRFDSFASHYVEAFERVCHALAKGVGACVFYPSTTYLDRAAPGFAEYASAKAAGEALCRRLARERASLSIVVERLPRMHTDQTNSFLERKAVDPHEVMLGVARRMHRSRSNATDMNDDGPRDPCGRS